MNDLMLLGGVPGLLLGFWSSWTPLQQDRFPSLALFGIGGSIGAALGALSALLSVILLTPVEAGALMFGLLPIAFYALLGCLISRVLSQLLAWLNPQRELHKGLYYIAFGLFAGLTTGIMFGMVTVGSGALENLYENMQ